MAPKVWCAALQRAGSTRHVPQHQRAGVEYPAQSIQWRATCGWRQGVRRVRSVTMNLNILLIDDHYLFGVGFAHALSAAAPDIRVLTAMSLLQGLDMAGTHAELDIVLVDYHLGAHNGIEGLRRFGQQFPLIARVLISGDETPTLLSAARAAGASGFIDKSQTLAHMLAALRTVAQGGLAFGAIPRSELPAVNAAAAPQPTLRQLEVLTLVAHGQPNKRIASALGIAERTVKLHVTALLSLLGARNRTHLLVLARERGLL